MILLGSLFGFFEEEEEEGGVDDSLLDELEDDEVVGDSLLEEETPHLEEPQGSIDEIDRDEHTDGSPLIDGEEDDDEDMDFDSFDDKDEL
jgi:hypothetical protein